MSDIIVGSITNVVKFKIDQNSYNRALKAIKRIAGAWSQATSKMSKSMAAGQRMAGGGGTSRRSSSGSFMGPLPFSPGTNTKMIEKRAKQEAAATKKAARIRARGEAQAAKEWANKRKEAIRSLTGSSGSGKASGTLFADMLRGEAKKMSGPMGPLPFKPGQNTRAQNKAANMEARRLSRAESTITSGGIGKDAGFISAYSKQIAMLNQQLRNGAITTGIYNKQLNTMARDFRKASQEGKGLFGTLHDLRGEFVALTASYTLFAGGKAVMQTGQMFQGIEAGMSMTSDNAVDAGQKLEFLRNEAYRLGLDLKVAAQGFTQMNVAGKEIMSSGQLQELFTGFSEYATALGVDQFRYEKGILAIGQMLNKQTIMAEEFKL